MTAFAPITPHPWPGVLTPRGVFLLVLLWGLLAHGQTWGRAPPGGEVRFVAVGDTGTGEEAQYRVAEAMRRHCRRRGCDFVLLLGDNFYPSGVKSVEDPLWRERFERPYRSLGIPFYVALGNHDYGRNDKVLDFRRSEPQVAYGRHNPDWILPAPVHAFRRGPVTFLVLDTTALLVQHDDALNRQGAFVTGALEQAHTPWIIVLGHHPYVSDGPAGNAGAYHRLDRPELKGLPIKRFFEHHLCGRMDVYLAGHEHNRQVLPGPAACPGLFVISGAGALTRDPGRDGSALFKSAGLGFAYLHATATRLTLEMINVRGDVDYTREIVRHP